MGVDKEKALPTNRGSRYLAPAWEILRALEHRDIEKLARLDDVKLPSLEELAMANGLVPELGELASTEGEDDALQPNVIWRELRFDKLVGTNLHVKDFSDWLAQRSSEDQYSVIVGNPPFMSKLNASAQKHRASKLRSTTIPDNQMAYFILEESVALLSEGGKLCLIQPNGFPFQR